MAAKAAAKAKKIPTFQYEGTDKSGAKVTGELNAQNLNLAKAELRKQGIKPAKLKKKPVELSFGAPKITPMDIALFTRQMATMLKSGVPLLQSFDIIADGVENPSVRKLVTELKGDVGAGNSLAVALRRRPKIFDELYCNLVDAGEQAGALEGLLDRVATYKEKSEALKAKVKKAMTYPISVMVVAGIVTSILLIKVVPQFEEVFAGFGAELPAFTKMVIRMSEFLQAWWWVGLAIIVATGVILKQLSIHSEAYRNGVDRLILKLPLIGVITNKSCVARFARTLSTTFAAGVPLVQALDSVAGAVGNVVYRNAVLRIQQDVSTGIQLNTSMRTSGVFPGMAIQMTSIGEESGALDTMLDKVAEYYEAEVDNMVDNMTTLMEPIIMAVLGVLVGGLIIAMYLPIFTLGSVVG